MQEKKAPNQKLLIDRARKYDNKLNNVYNEGLKNSLNKLIEAYNAKNN